MEEIHIDNLPSEIRKTFLNSQVDIVLEIIEKAGLLLEFQAFTESEEACKVKSFDELCTEFAKKHPEKLHVVPTEDRYNKLFLCTSMGVKFSNKVWCGKKWDEPTDSRLQNDTPSN